MALSTATTNPISTTTAWLAAAPRDEQNDSELPQWYLDRQNKWWETFQSATLPSRLDQEWRFADLKKMRFEGFATAGAVSVEVAQSLIARAQSNCPEHFSAHYVFANNRLIHSEIRSIPEGGTCLPIQEALVEYSDLAEAHFMREEHCLGSAVFRALHGAASLSGIFVHATGGAEFAEPIVVHHFGAGELCPFFPHTLVVAEQGSQVSVIENFESVHSGDSAISIGVVDLDASENSHIQYVSVQDVSEQGGAKHVQLNNTRVGKDSQIKSFFLNLGAAWVRNESLNRMIESGADSQIYGASLATNLQEFDQRTLQCHEAQHTTSNLLFKNALYDEARTIFGGLIQVLPGAHHTDSYQTCRNLLGSDKAEANAMPGLEIDADQVRCSHGSTSGQISDEEIFYLQARGIPSEKARRMISFGFLNEVVQKLSGEKLREFLSAKVDKKFRDL